MLQLEAISLRMGDFHLSADLALAKGRRLGVLGPSGGGKSTLLSVIAGFLTPDAGQIRIDSEVVTNVLVPQRPLSLLFQEGNLFPHLTVFQNVGLGLRPDLRFDSDQQGAIGDALEQVGLSGMDARLPGDLSGGQRSRVALARMLLRQKPLALLDEPFAALDPGLRSEMLALVDELCVKTGLTLVMVSHDLRDVEKLCTDLCLLEDGAISLYGPLEQILANPPAALKPWM